MKNKYSKIYLSIVTWLMFSMTNFSSAQTTGVGLCKTLQNIETILNGISIVVVTLAVMWSGYKFLFARAEISECGKILAAGIMIGSASTIAGWFMGGTSDCKDTVTVSIEIENKVSQELVMNVYNDVFEYIN